LLEKMEAFQSLKKNQLSRLKYLCEELVFHKDARLFTEGDPATHLWLVVEGQTDLRFEMPDKHAATKEQTVSSVKVKPQKPEAKTLGWSCFVPPYKMRLSAYCDTDICRVIRIPKNELMQLFENDPLMGYRFMAYLITVVGYRFHQFQDVVAKTMGDSMMTGW
jgi:CRP-like cAMP-binding protein